MAGRDMHTACMTAFNPSSPSELVPFSERCVRDLLCHRLSASTMTPRRPTLAWSSFSVSRFMPSSIAAASAAAPSSPTVFQDTSNMLSHNRAHVM